MSEQTERAADTTESAQIRIYPDGPMLVRGDVQIVSADGDPLPRRRRVTALCRCGHSSLNPLCDGTHKLIRRFRPDSPMRTEALRDS